MLTELDLLTAKVEALDYVFEVMVANAHSCMSPAAAKQLRDDLLSRGRTVTVPPGIDPEYATAAHSAFQDALANLLERIERRSANIRALAERHGMA